MRQEWTLRLGMLGALAQVLGCAVMDGGGDRMYEGDDDYYGDADSDMDADTDADSDPENDEEVVAPPTCEDAVDDERTVAMSADDSNSQADPVEVRQLIEAGLTIRGSLRLYEFLNYYDFDYEPAETGSIRVVPQMRLRPGDGGEYSMLVAVVAPAMHRLDSRYLNLTFSVDSSGSMSGAPVERTKDVLRAVAAGLREGDVVSLVTWDTRAMTLLESHSAAGPDDPFILSAIERLEAGGSTNLEMGLRTAYELADDNFEDGRLNRVILISDGGANTGITEEEIIAAHAEDAEAEAIYLVGVGTANAGGYNDFLMDTVTDLGKGAYMYIDSEEEARHMFSGERFLANMEIAARSVELEMTMPQRYVINEFHGEQISDDPKEVEPQHLAPNDAMLYHLYLLDCAEQRDGDETFRFTVRWRDPETRESFQEDVSATVDEMQAETNTQIVKADAIIAYAKALTDVWQQANRRAYLDGIAAQIDDAIQARPEDADLAEVRYLLDLYSQNF